MIKTPEEMAKGKLLKKIMMYTLFGMIIIIIGDFSFSVITGNIYNFFSSGFGIIVFGAVWVNYYITFKKPLLHLRYSIFNFVATSLITITVLTYIVGGFSGAMISSFFIAIVVYSLLLNKKESMILSLLIITIYLVFYFGEFTGLIIPLTNCSLANNTCKAAIDIFSFMVVALFGTIISENANNSIKYNSDDFKTAVQTGCASSAKTSSAASRVAANSPSPCMADTNPASKAEGAR